MGDGTFVQIGINGHVHTEATMLKIKTVRFSFQQAAAPVTFPYAGNIAFGKQTVNMCYLWQKPRILAEIIHLGEKQQPFNTGSASMNKTMPRLLELAENAEVILTGPSVPMCPELFSLGISRLYGVIIEDVDAMCRGIVESKGSVNRYSGRFCLNRGTF